MQTLKTILLVLSFVVQAFAQQVEVVPFANAVVAKAVKVEQLNGSVVVFFTEREAGDKSGALLRVTSEKKWATPWLPGYTISPTSVAGEWVLFAGQGKYSLTLIEFDPERGPLFSTHPIQIGAPNPDDPGEDDPTDPPLPPDLGDYAAVKRAAKESADALNDPKTRSALLVAYKNAVSAIAGRSYEDAVLTVKSARRFVLSARLADSRKKDWETWLITVDDELKKAVKPGDVVAYASAVNAIIAGLE